MMNTVVDKAKGFLLAPAESFRKSRGDSLGPAFRYYVVLLIIYSILAAIVSVAVGMYAFNDMIAQLAQSGIVGSALADALGNMGSFVAAMTIFAVYLFFLISLLGIFITGLVFHAFVLLFGGEKGVRKTITTTMYASTPYFLLGWIPYVSIIGYIWYLVLLIIGIREMQEIDTGKALLVVITPIILVFILLLLGGFVIAALMQGFLDMIPFMG